MHGEQYLTKPEQFKAVFNKGASLVDKLVVMKFYSNGLSITRYGFSVSSRVGGAVIRNKIKRRMREILRSTTIEPGWDIVLIARPAAARTDFNTLFISISKLLERAHVIPGDAKITEVG